ncbi:carboxypeptidase regulatory-like domain-containing protein, partial [Mycobacterium tuberculosis]|uniref:carboxypeptidase-like regulatory domain-containing protein n=1 Tax=Mycobacterium tuberculosis TaxID=1773 RepID=UPI000E39BC5C
HAQSTTGAIAGQAPPSAQRIFVRSDTGLTREVTVDARGRYTISQLPLGRYSVEARDADGKVLQTSQDVALTVGTSTEVSFGDV